MAASQSTLTGCILFATTLDYISHAGYPPATRGRMHVNANVYCLGTGSRFNRKNSVMASPRSRENYNTSPESLRAMTIRLFNFVEFVVGLGRH